MALGAAALAAAEVYLAVRYAGVGALWHYFLHGLVGAGIGLAVWAALVRRPAPERVAPGLLVGAAGGHLVSAWPDVLFLGAGLPHEGWMDVFVAHISIHFVPAPLVVAPLLLVLGAGAAVLRTAGVGRGALAVALGAAAVAAAALALRAPLPGTLEEVRSLQERGTLNLACRLLPAGPGA